MSQKVLYNSKLKIKQINGIKKIAIGICNKDIPEKIKSVKLNIFSKSRIISHFRKKINKRSEKLLEVYANVLTKTPSVLAKTNVVLKLNFEINKNNYSNRKEFIYNNIDDLYRRITNLFNIVKTKIKDKYTIKSHEETFILKEKMFNMILTDLEFNHNEYSEITDKIIVTSILKFLQDKI